MLAVVLENISNNNISARATVSAVYQTAMTVSSIPNVSYYKKASNHTADFLFPFNCFWDGRRKLGSNTWPF